MFASSILQSISAVPTKSKFLFSPSSSSDRSNLILMESLFNTHYSHSHHHHDYTTSQSQSQVVVSLKFSPRFELSPNSSNTRRLVSLGGGGGDAGGETLEKEARAAVAELLREEGLSEEESIDIGSNSPNYVKMLIEGVLELDEASLWDSWKVVDGGGVGTGSGGSQLSFKEKVLHVARVKKDRGILPFLESTGLNPSTSTHVARYLSSETLLNLIHK